MDMGKQQLRLLCIGISLGSLPAFAGGFQFSLVCRIFLGMFTSNVSPKAQRCSSSFRPTLWDVPLILAVLNRDYTRGVPKIPIRNCQ